MSLGAPELEAIAADTIVGEAKRARRHALPLGSPCANCGAPLAGPWCHACGQKGEEFHRSIWRLIPEAFEGLTNFDSRFWNTVPRLIVRPGRLTREYLEGRRASQIPPFRLFLVVLVLVFFAGGLAADRNNTNFKLANPDDPMVTKNMSPKDKAEYEKGIAQVQAQLAADTPAAAKATVPGAAPTPDQAAPKRHSGRNLWAKGQLRKAMQNPTAFFQAMQEWGPRFAILMLPVAALMLSVLFIFKRGVYVFDHLIFSMHSLSFLGLLLTVIFLASIFVDGAWWLLLVAPVHLFIHMRGAYRTSVLGALLRMTLLFFGTSIAASILIAGLVVVGLAAVR